MEKEFETKDLALVSYLMGKGRYYVNFFYKDGAVWFTFRNNSEVENLTLLYHSRKALVDPVEFNSNYRILVRLVGNVMREARK